LSDYVSFLETKSKNFLTAGIDVPEEKLPKMLYPFQRKLVRWSLRKGKSALWCDTGTGKSFMQVSWARFVPGPVLILAPLCVSVQTISEARKLGIRVTPFGEGGRIQITNYEQIHNVDPSKFQGVVLDESSILKNFTGKTRTKLIQMFKDVPYRLCCTATPAPNDLSELANHCEFLGVMSRSEMLGTFFVHDDEGWRLKGHADRDFYRWLASWGLFLRKPSDLGFDDTGYNLPPLEMHESVVDVVREEIKEKGIRGHLKMRQSSVTERVEEVAQLILNQPGQWVALCGLNSEQKLLHEMLDGQSVSVSGTDDKDHKQAGLQNFLSGRIRVLISKPKIAGFGLNLQNCNRMAFVGIGHSFESYYQSIRRCWRFGQKKPVNVHIVISKGEEGVVEIVKKKEAEHQNTVNRLVDAMRTAEMEEISATARQEETVVRRVQSGPGWRMLNDDCIDAMRKIRPDSIDLSVYSPPFLSLYTYTASQRDMGNCTTDKEFLDHLGYAVREMLRITKPGRINACHISQIAAQKAKHGFIGMIDLRGMVIKLFVDNGWIYHGETCIAKNPQAQAIRTHAKGLLFAQLKKDSSWMRPAIADYILLFRKPGDNVVPIKTSLSTDEWIAWANPVWLDIRETETLNRGEAREEKDDRHICPLQLSVIERCIRLWSNKGDLVFSPFAGIGSEGFQALRLGRRFMGIELKPGYYDVACKNLERALDPEFQLKKPVIKPKKEK
jgi:DNA modification methylase